MLIHLSFWLLGATASRASEADRGLGFKSFALASKAGAKGVAGKALASLPKGELYCGSNVYDTLEDCLSKSKPNGKCGGIESFYVCGSGFCSAGADLQAYYYVKKDGALVFTASTGGDASNPADVAGCQATADTQTDPVILPVSGNTCYVDSNYNGGRNFAKWKCFTRNPFKGGNRKLLGESDSVDEYESDNESAAESDSDDEAVSTISKAGAAAIQPAPSNKLPGADVYCFSRTYATKAECEATPVGIVNPTDAPFYVYTVVTAPTLGVCSPYLYYAGCDAGLCPVRSGFRDHMYAKEDRFLTYFGNGGQKEGCEQEALGQSDPIIIAGGGHTCIPKYKPSYYDDVPGTTLYTKWHCHTKKEYKKLKKQI